MFAEFTFSCVHGVSSSPHKVLFDMARKRRAAKSEQNPTQQQRDFKLPAPEPGRLPFSPNPRAQNTPAFSHCKPHQEPTLSFFLRGDPSHINEQPGVQQGSVTHASFVTATKATIGHVSPDGRGQERMTPKVILYKPSFQPCVPCPERSTVSSTEGQDRET